MRLRVGKFTRVVLALGAVAGLLLVLRPMLPKQMRYEIDDFFRRPFIPHFIVPVHALKPVPAKQMLDELNARGFDVRCYGNLAPSERITSMDDAHCWTTLNTAFDHIPARDLRLWFQKDTLVHVRFEFPGHGLHDGLRIARFLSRGHCALLPRGRPRIRRAVLRAQRRAGVLQRRGAPCTRAHGPPADHACDAGADTDSAQKGFGREAPRE